MNGVARFLSVCVASDTTYSSVIVLSSNFKGANVSMGGGHACLCIKDALEIQITDELIYISSS